MTKTPRGHTVFGTHRDPLMDGTLTKRNTGYRRSDFTPNRTLFDVGELFTCALWLVGVLGALTLLAAVQP